MILSDHTASLLLNDICGLFHVTRDKVIRKTSKGRSQRTDVIYARHVYAEVLRAMGASYHKIAEIIGFDRSSAIHAVNNVETFPQVVRYKALSLLKTYAGTVEPAQIWMRRYEDERQRRIAVEDKLQFTRIQRDEWKRKYLKR